MNMYKIQHINVENIYISKSNSIQLPILGVTIVLIIHSQTTFIESNSFIYSDWIFIDEIQDN